MVNKLSYLIFGDIQARGTDFDFAAPGSKSFLSDVYRSLMWVADLVREKKPDIIVCLGDVVDSPHKVDVPALACISQCFSAIAESHLEAHPGTVGTILVLSGNHDAYLETGDCSSIELFFLNPVFEVIQRPKRVGEGLYIPFMKSGFESAIKTVTPQDAIVFFHQTVSGVQSGGQELAGEAPELFQDQHRIFISGHIHQPQTVGNVFYPGALLSEGYGDDYFKQQDNFRGAWFVGPSRHIEKHRNPYSPCYATLTTDQVEAHRKAIGPQFKLRVIGPADQQPQGLPDGLEVKRIITDNVQDVQRTDVSLGNDMSANLTSYFTERTPAAPDLLDVVRTKYFPKLGGYVSATLQPLVFESLVLTDCLSFATAEVVLNQNPGVVLVEGRNQDDPLRESNESGKTNLFKALHWVLFGGGGEVIRGGQKKATGVLKVANRDHQYVVTRTKTASAHTLNIVRDGLDVTPAHLLEASKFLASELGVSESLFTSLIYFSHGLSGGFGEMSGGLRTELLESVLDVRPYKALNDLIAGDHREAVEQMRGLEGGLALYTRQLDSFNAQVREIDRQLAEDAVKTKAVRDRIDGELESHRLELKAAQTREADIALRVAEFTGRQMEQKKLVELATAEYHEADAQYRVAMARTKEAGVALQRAKTVEGHAACSYCGGPLTGGGYDQHIAGLSDAVEQAVAGESLAQAERQLLGETRDKALEVLREIEGPVVLLNNEAREVAASISHIHQAAAGLDLQRSRLDTMSSALHSNRDLISKNIQRVQAEQQQQLGQQHGLEQSIAVLGELQQLTGERGIQSYLFDNMLSTINRRLAYYSGIMFGDELSFSLSPEKNLKKGGLKNELTTVFTGRVTAYTQLSGSASRLVNLAIHLSIYDFANNCGFSSNIGVYDEIFDTMDDGAVDCCLQALAEDTKRVSYVISHIASLKSRVGRSLVVTKKGGVSHITSPA